VESRQLGHDPTKVVSGCGGSGDVVRPVCSGAKLKDLFMLCGEQGKGLGAEVS
jgi:hypothetical protein